MSIDELREAIERVELQSSGVVRVSAERTGSGALETVDIQLTQAVALNPGRLDYRFDFEGTLRGGNADPIGKVSLSLVSRYEVKGEQVSEVVAQAFGHQVAFPVAYPYIREAAQALADRIGFPGFVMGLFRASDGAIRSACVGGQLAGKPEGLA